MRSNHEGICPLPAAGVPCFRHQPAFNQGSALRLVTARWRVAVSVLLLLAVAAAAAQDRWTIQTVAFPDFRLAQAESDRLASLGLDVYTEFTMHEGNQYTRIRVGCYESRPAAELMAGVIAGSFTNEAIVQPISEDSSPEFCLRDDIGFIKPIDWSVQSQDTQQIVFRVQLGGQTGFVRMRGGEWRLLTEIEPATAVTSATVLDFEQVAAAGEQLVRARIAGNHRLICLGRLLWQAGRTAVVERGNAVSACVVEPVTPGALL